MANFNSKKLNSSLTRNSAGGVAYKESLKAELATLLLTSFLSGNKAYQSNDEVVERLLELCSRMIGEDKTFLAKASLYARDKYQMRSVSHVVSAAILGSICQEGWSDEDKRMVRRYLSKVAMRPDDITETIACYSNRADAYKSKKGRVQLPNVAKKGFSDAMSSYDEYRMAKYRNEDKEISLLDAVRMSHVKATEKNKSALDKLIAGTLKVFSTWSAKLSKAGEKGTKEEVEQAKKEAWSEFVAKGNKVEYFALLRNLRNILEQADTDTLNKACALLSDSELISKSRVLPFRYLSAYKAVELSSEKSSVKRNEIVRALNRAVEASLSNVPKFEGTTAILLDVSGSMSSYISSETRVKYSDIANMFAAILYKTNDCDVILFNDRANPLRANPEDSVFTIMNSIPCGGGTDMSAAFRAIQDEKYDRIIVLSDMNTWADSRSFWGSSTGSDKLFNQYKKKHGLSNCQLFSFDLSGDGTLQFPENNVFLLAGWSSESFNLMSRMAEDKQFLIHEIEAIEL